MMDKAVPSLSGAIKTNDNFRELYENLGDGTSIGIATLTQLKLSGILTRYISGCA